jgi:hypothetical protein
MMCPAGASTLDLLFDVIVCSEACVSRMLPYVGEHVEV